MSRQSILQEIYIALLTSYCNMVELNLTHSTLRKSSTSLLRYTVLSFFHYIFSTQTAPTSKHEYSAVQYRLIYAVRYLRERNYVMRMQRVLRACMSDVYDVLSACCYTTELIIYGDSIQQAFLFNGHLKLHVNKCMVRLKYFTNTQS